MQHKAKIFMNNRSQAVRLPKEFQFKTREVFIRKEGNDVVLSTRPFDWSSYLAEGGWRRRLSWMVSRSCRCRSASANAALHAYWHLLVHHEAIP
jgi:virulence-associated protein VagC